MSTLGNTRPFLARLVRVSSGLSLTGVLGGCSAVVLHPAGDVAVQQRDLLLISTALMLLIILPVMALTVAFAWRYRQSNAAARYEPDWDHSTQLELIIWSAPLLIIICLGAITWMGTHLLDPYRPLGRIADGRPVAANAKPLEVEVVALDWKWLFIYPEYGVATVNELSVPVNRPIAFKITSSTVMNSFYVPALSGQIYAMPGMETRLHAVANQPGDYEGISANYSGAGFSGMHFRVHALTAQSFATWVQGVKAGGGALDRKGYLVLERPTEDEPVRRYAAVDPALFSAALNMCVEPGKMCMGQMMTIDAKGGLGLQSARNTLPLVYDKVARRGAVMGASPSYIAALCRLQDPAPTHETELVSRPHAPALAGAGLAAPPMTPAPFLSIASATPVAPASVSTGF
jgi:cytochrome o ubiquinol oxidase subunit 2